MFDSSAGGSASSSLYRSPEFVAIIFIDERDQAQPKKDSFSDSDDDEAATAKASKPVKAPRKILPKSMQSVDGKARLEGVLRWLEDGNISGESMSTTTCEIRLNGCLSRRCHYRS